MEIRTDPKTGHVHQVDPETNRMIWDDKCKCGHPARYHARVELVEGEKAGAQQQQHTIGTGPCLSSEWGEPPCSCKQFDKTGYFYVDEMHD